MSLNVKALTIAGAILWGGCMFLVGLANLIWTSYGVGCLELAASIYPGYHGPAGFWSVLVVTLYALVDGAVAGAVLACVYNWAARPETVAKQG